MHRSLAEAVLKTFRDDTDQEHGAVLASFPLSVWTANYFWLDASGLALYFLDRVRELELEATVPVEVRRRLEQNLADNRLRTEDTFAEWMRVDAAFAERDIEYVNVKGLTLFPQAFKDPALRVQLDLDVVAYAKDAQRCQEALESLGYVLVSAGREDWEFRTPSTRMPSIDDLYRPKPQRAIEVHFRYGGAMSVSPAMSEWRVFAGQRLPVLPEVEAFLGQATHVLKHLRSEWIRLSWLLEFRHSVRYWADDAEFWRRLQETAAEDAELCTAIGATVLIAATIFGQFAPEGLVAWTVERMDRGMRLWVDRYGWDMAMAEFPGTKLYLLQPASAVREGVAVSDDERRSLLVPLHRPPMVVDTNEQSSLRERVRAVATQARYFGFRLRFHVTAGYRYMREARRWRRHLAEAQESEALS
jgi:Uncharacterised nucleotidyltransferase